IAGLVSASRLPSDRQPTSCAAAHNRIAMLQWCSFLQENAMKNPWVRAKATVEGLILAGVLGAMPMAALAAEFDIDVLPIDVGNRYPNVGVWIGAIVDDEGNPVVGLVHCSGVLLHERVFLTAGHCTAPTAFPLPPTFGQFVSIGVDVLDKSQWIRVARNVT